MGRATERKQAAWVQFVLRIEVSAVTLPLILIQTPRLILNFDVLVVSVMTAVMHRATRCTWSYEVSPTDELFYMPSKESSRVM